MKLPHQLTLIALLYYLVTPPVATAQMHSNSWSLQVSNATASLRGIYAVDEKVAWTSGTEGTILRTIDGGQHWTPCTIPDAATDGKTLDFRGIQAWDSDTAFTMASGPGEKSRLYKTADGCKTWTLVLKNPDKDGFWDSISTADRTNLMILGDPVAGRFVILDSLDGGRTWNRASDKGLQSKPGEGAFAASNSALSVDWIGGPALFGTGGPEGARIFLKCDECKSDAHWAASQVAAFPASSSSGIFSIAMHSETGVFRNVISTRQTLVAVGGDYSKPAESHGTAAFSADGGKLWTASPTPPHGYRSAVQWSDKLNAWITVGTNGSDISRDDGKTWTPLQDPIMCDGNWNALSLPFVVGPNGRIAHLNR